jgi:hypothetical protein
MYKKPTGWSFLGTWKTSRVVVHRFMVPECGLDPDPDPVGKKGNKK